MGRKPDLAFEALCKATGANEHVDGQRAKINTALKGIRAAWKADGLVEDDLPAEIERRAGEYQRKWPTLTLTPMALAVHWNRLISPPPLDISKYLRD